MNEVVVYDTQKAVLIHTDNPVKITTVVPTAKPFVMKGRPMVAVPHGLDETRVLRSLGFSVPGPVCYHYKWSGPFTPFLHQLATVEFLTLNQRAYVLSGMGSGKTLCALWAFDYLRNIGQAKRILITAPLSTLERVWADEVFKHFPHLNCAVLHGSAARRKKMLADKDNIDVFVINHHGVDVVKDELIKLVTDGEIDVVTIDELAVYRNAKAAMWSSLNSVVKNIKWLWGMTGSPTPNAPTDAYAQVRMITPHRVPKYFGQFKDSVMRQVTQFKWVPKAESHAIVTDAMKPAIRFKREECIDLPPTTYETRQVDLNTEQKKIYKDMLSRLYAEFDGGQLLAVNEAVKASKLVQICSGCAYNAQGEAIEIPAKERLAVVEEVIEQSEGKVIVFVPFTGALHAVRDALLKTHSVGVIAGEISKHERDMAFKAFQDGDLQVLVAQPAAMAHGLTLTAASTIVWYAPVWSNEIYEQANARIVRPGQKRNTLILHIQGAPIEERIYARLRDKGVRQSTLLDMIKAEMG